MNFYEHFYPGSQHPEDVDVLVNVMHEYQLEPCRLIEIGVLTGQTARGLKRIADEFGTSLMYTGVDPVSPTFHNFPREPFPGAVFMQMDSLEAFHVLAGKFDVVISDGCHCFNHVVMETLLYGSIILPGGWMIFHDTNPKIQQTMRDPHGPHVAAFHNSVRAAHDFLGFPNKNWRKVYESVYGEGRLWGGFIAYQKL